MKTQIIYDKYEINELGEITNIKTGQIIRQSIIQNSGYKKVTLTLKGKQITKTVHRLMGMAFLGLEEGDKRIVEHTDNDKTNNKLDNLKVMTQSENMKKYLREKKAGVWEQKTDKAILEKSKEHNRRKYLRRKGELD